MVITRSRRALVALVLALGVIPVSTASAVAATQPPIPVCDSPTSPVYAEYLRQAMQSAAATSEGVAIGLYDRRSDVTCYFLPDRKFNTASVVKVLIATALQWRAQQQSRPLDPVTEDQVARDMITSPDDTTSNNAATALWGELYLNGPYVAEVIGQLGLADTVPADKLGMTETTVRDQVKVMTFLTSPHQEFLERERRDYVLGLMSEVPLQHRFGVPVNAPAQWHNKIGYAKLDDGWQGYFNYRTHSVGAVRGPDNLGRDHDYVMVLLSDGNLPLEGMARVSAAATILNAAKRLLPQ